MKKLIKQKVKLSDKKRLLSAKKLKINSIPQQYFYLTFTGLMANRSKKWANDF